MRGQLRDRLTEARSNSDSRRLSYARRRTMNPATIEFKLDADYYREFHAEWVEAVGRGWRIDRIMIRVFLAGGAGLAVAGLLLSMSTLSVPGALLCIFGAFEFFKGKRRKSRWLSHVQSLPWSGKTLRIEVEDGALIQKHDFRGAPPLARRSELLDTPNGYLLKLHFAQEQEVPDSAISSTKASIYIPHRRIEPPMSRETFRGLLR